MPSIQQIRNDAAKTVETVTDQTTKRVGAVAEDVTRASATVRDGATRLLTDPTPLYAVVGLTDTVVTAARSTVQDTVQRASDLGRALSPKAASETVSDRTVEVSQAAERLAGRTVTDVTGRLGRVQESYQGLATRGQGLVDRIKEQPATKELSQQVSSVVEQGRQWWGTTTKTPAPKTATTTPTGKVTATTARAPKGASTRATATKSPSTKSASTKTTATKSPSTKATTKNTASKSRATKATGTKSSTTKRSTTSTATRAKTTGTRATRSASTASTAKPAADSTTTGTSSA